MAIELACPGCRKSYRVSDSLAGKTARCTVCGTTMTVPSAVAAPPVVAPRPTAPAPPVVTPAKAAKERGTYVEPIEEARDVGSLLDEELRMAPMAPSGMGAGGTKLCIDCGAQLPSSAVLCTACGMDLRSGRRLGPKAPSSGSSMPQRRGRGSLRIAGTGIRLVMAGVSMLTLMQIFGFVANLLSGLNNGQPGVNAGQQVNRAGQAPVAPPAAAPAQGVAAAPAAGPMPHPPAVAPRPQAPDVWEQVDPQRDAAHVPGLGNRPEFDRNPAADRHRQIMEDMRQRQQQVDEQMAQHREWARQQAEAAQRRHQQMRERLAQQRDLIGQPVQDQQPRAVRGAGPGAAIAALGLVFLGLLGFAVLAIVFGHILCLFTPAETGAKKYVIGAILTYIAALTAPIWVSLLALAIVIGVDPQKAMAAGAIALPVSVLIGLLLIVAGQGVFVMYLRQFAHYLDRRDLADDADTVLSLMMSQVGLFILFVIAVLIATFLGAPPDPMRWLGILGGGGLLLWWFATVSKFIMLLWGLSREIFRTAVA